jgi:alpha-glucan,water dikinase
LIVLLWQEVAQSIEKLKIRLAQEDFSALGEIRKAVLNLIAPMQLVRYLYVLIFVAIKT